jgi:hypothetical protein
MSLVIVSFTPPERLFRRGPARDDLPARPGDRAKGFA